MLIIDLFIYWFFMRLLFGIAYICLYTVSMLLTCSYWCWLEILAVSVWNV